jgi:acyl-CoA dehydrogenase
VLGDVGDPEPVRARSDELAVHQVLGRLCGGVAPRADDFIEREIEPLQAQDDNERFFDHRREDARTDWDRGGLPNEEWEALLAEMRRRADAAGHYRYAFPKEYGRKDGTNLGMAVIREHLARKGLGLHNDLQNEASIVGNNVGLLLMLHHGTEEQQAEWVPKLLEGTSGFAFGITEPEHGSDATHMETTASRDGDEWVINGEKTWSTGMHKAPYELVFARTSGRAGDGDGITAFRPHEQPRVRGRRVPVDVQHADGPCPRAADRCARSALVGVRRRGNGLGVVQLFFNENRIRHTASSLGAAEYCLDRAIDYANERAPFGKPLAHNQGIQFPIVELVTQCEMLRTLIRQTAWKMDEYGAFSVSKEVSMCNYWANRLCCEAADRAMQVFGGLGYSRHQQFEHIYRHHRRYRITEGSEEIQMRRVAGYLFGFMRQQAPKGVTSGDGDGVGRRAGSAERG